MLFRFASFSSVTVVLLASLMCLQVPMALAYVGIAMPTTSLPAFLTTSAVLTRSPPILRVAKVSMSLCESRSSSSDDSLAASWHEPCARRGFFAASLASFIGVELLSTPAHAQPAAGLDVNKGGGRFEDVDLSKLPKEESKPSGQSKKKAAGLAVFQDDVLGYGFAIPPNFKGQSQSVDGGGQVIAFFDEDTSDINTRVTLVAQPSPVKSLTELKEAFVPSGELRQSQTIQKSVGKADGEVYVVETSQEDKVTMITLFALRKQPAPAGSWLVSLTAQASPRVFGKYDKDFRAIIKSFRLIYPDVDFRNVLDEELGKSVGDVQLSDKINAVPFGGK